MAFPSSPTLGQRVENPVGSGDWWICVDVGPPPMWEREVVVTPPTGDRYQNTYSGATWTVGHNLSQQYVSVQCIDAAGNLIVGDPAYTSNAVLTLTFSEPVSGTAVVRR